jgi:hypothetical protein
MTTPTPTPSPEPALSTPVAVVLEKVIEDEHKEIARRRQAVGLPQPISGDAGKASANATPPVGLSLSGGGIRSGSFCLGFIQSLHLSGLLRYIDYLSTVSGGGYAGASLSSELLHPRTRLNWAGRVERNGRHSDPRHLAEAPAADSTDGFYFGLAPDQQGRQPRRVRDLVNGGTYLRKPLPFCNRWLIGVVLIGTVAASGMLALTALAAYLFRCLDNPWVAHRVEALGFHGDVHRGLFPFWVALGTWMVAWSVSYWRRWERAGGKVAQWLLLITAVLLLMGLSALLGTGDIDLSYLRDLFGQSSSRYDTSVLTDVLRFLIPGLLGFSLLPYLAPRELIRSGIHPKNAVESWVFAIASRALLYGVPLLLFGWLAGENISGYNEERWVTQHGAKFSTLYRLVPSDFPDWNDAWNRFEREASDHGSPVQKLSAKLWEGVKIELEGDPEPAIERWRRAWNEATPIDRKLGLVNRWSQALAYVLVPGIENDFNKLVRDSDEMARLEKEICKRSLANWEADSELLPFGEDLSVITDASLSKEAEEALGRAIQRLMARHRELETQEWIAHPVGGSEKWTYQTWRDKVSTQIKLVKEPTSTADAKELSRLFQLGDGWFLRLKREISPFNWDTLRTVYPDRFDPKTKVFARVVQPEDQKTRLSWLCWSFLVFLISGLLVNLNACSLHGFYKDRLADMWIEPCPGMGTEIPLALLETTSRGGPYHILGATLNSMKLGTEVAKAPDDVFIFSQAYCGSMRTGFIPTGKFAGGKYDLASATALSGAALSPAYFQNPLLWMLMLLTNLRLGQWLPNPANLRSGPLRRLSEVWGPVPVRFVAEMITSAWHAIIRSPSSPRAPFFCYITDGGYIENLGLEQLLLRRCRLIIACDVSCDPKPEFDALMDIIRRVRIEQGIHIHRFESAKHGARTQRLDTHEDIGLADLCPLGTKQAHLTLKAEEDRFYSEKHVLLARIVYPNERGDPDAAPSNGHHQSCLQPEDQGVLIYVKPTLNGDEEADLIRYWGEQRDFPHDPSMDQFYTPGRFESYRQLGFHSGWEVIRALAEIDPKELARLLGPDGRALIENWAGKSQETPPPSSGKKASRSAVPS